MDIKPRQCIAALNAHVRSGFSLIGDAEISVRAKDVIETIQQLVLKLNEANKAYEASEVDSGFEALTAYHHGYQDGLESAQPKWISVEERLPKINERVSVCNRYFKTNAVSVAVDKLTLWANNKPVWCSELDSYKGAVTHWMPLPEPPK